MTHQTNRLPKTDDDLCVVALVKGGERYTFTYLPRRRDELLRVFGRMAVDPDLSFSWYDAAVLSKKVKQQG